MGDAESTGQLTPHEKLILYDIYAVMPHASAGAKSKQKIFKKKFCLLVIIYSLYIGIKLYLCTLESHYYVMTIKTTFRRYCTSTYYTTLLL